MISIFDGFAAKNQPLKVILALEVLAIALAACRSSSPAFTPDAQQPTHTAEQTSTPATIGEYVTQEFPVYVLTIEDVLRLITEIPAETAEFKRIAESFIDQNSVFVGKSIEEAGLNALLVRDATSGQSTIYFIGYDQSSGIEWLFGYSWNGGLEQTNTPLYRTATDSVYYTDEEGNAVELVQHQPDGTCLVRTYSGTYTEAPADVPDNNVIGNAAPIPAEFITATSIQYMDDAYVALDASNNIIAILDAESHEWHQAVRIAATLGGGPENAERIASFPIMTTEAPENPNYPLIREENGEVISGFIACDNGSLGQDACLLVGRVAGFVPNATNPKYRDIIIDVPTENPNKYMRITARTEIMEPGYRLERDGQFAAIGNLEETLARTNAIMTPSRQISFHGSVYSLDQPLTQGAIRPLWDLISSDALIGMPFGIKVRASQQTESNFTGDATPTHIENLLNGVLPPTNLDLAIDDLQFLPASLIDLLNQ